MIAIIPYEVKSISEFLSFLMIHLAPLPNQCSQRDACKIIIVIKKKKKNGKNATLIILNEQPGGLKQLNSL